MSVFNPQEDGQVLDAVLGKAITELATQLQAALESVLDGPTITITVSRKTE